MRSQVAFALLLATGACSGVPTRVLRIDPPDSSVFVNGEPFDSGGSRPVKFDFSKVDRICIQATHRDCEPHFELLDAEKVQLMIDSELQVMITLKPR